MKPVDVGPDYFSMPWLIGFAVIFLIALAVVAWRKGWLGKETEDRIKARRDKLMLEVHELTEKLKALERPAVPAGMTQINTNAALIAALRDLHQRGVMTQEQYDAAVLALVTPVRG